MFLFGIILSVWFIGYMFLPEKITGKKYEYIKCIGSALFLFTCLFFLVTRVILTGENWKGVDSDTSFIVCYWIFLSVYHLIYPFKKDKRNQTVTFFLLGTALTFILFGACAWVLVALGGM